MDKESNKNEVLEVKNKELETQMMCLLEAMKEIKSRVNILENENESLRKENQTIVDIRRLSLEISEMKIRMAKLESTSEDKIAQNYIREIENLKSNLKREEEQNETLSIKNKENIDKQNELKVEVERLKLEIEKRDNKNAKLEKEIIAKKEEKENEINKLKIDFESELQGLRKKSEEKLEEKEETFKRVEQFLKWDKVYNKYLLLDSKIRDALKGIFKGDNSMTFLYCGLKEENIENLWEYIKDKTLNNPENSDTEILEEIFIEFFNAYNETFDKSIFEIQKVEVGQEFDDFEFIRTSHSLPVGAIKKVLFHGYCRVSDKKVMRKTIVVV
ncbi:MAG: hypothetical protein ACRC30_15705 [Clostridium sp.]